METEAQKVKQLAQGQRAKLEIPSSTFSLAAGPLQTLKMLGSNRQAEEFSKMDKHQENLHLPPNPTLGNT